MHILYIIYDIIYIYIYYVYIQLTTYYSCSYNIDKILTFLCFLTFLTLYSTQKKHS